MFGRHQQAVRQAGRKVEQVGHRDITRCIRTRWERTVSGGFPKWASDRRGREPCPAPRSRYLCGGCFHGHTGSGRWRVGWSPSLLYRFVLEGPDEASGGLIRGESAGFQEHQNRVEIQPHAAVHSVETSWEWH